MSGIYITGLALPVGKPDEPTAVWLYPDGSVKAFYNCGNDIVDTWAFAVSDHGALIERDRAIDALRPADFMLERDADCTWGEIYEQEYLDLIILPTVIPADEEGNI